MSKISIQLDPKKFLGWSTMGAALGVKVCLKPITPKSGR